MEAFGRKTCVLCNLYNNRTPQLIKTFAMSFGLKMIRLIRLWIDYLINFLFSMRYVLPQDTVPPITNRILLLSATKMAAKIRDGSLKSEHLVQAHIDRINEVNGILNAVVSDRFSAALQEAKEVDKRIEAGEVSKEEFNQKIFLGVPFTTKESTLCKGMKASFGLIPRKDMMAEEDADIIKVFKTSGAILLAVTNVPQLNLWTETHNPVYGITKNPYNVTRNAGGSSGGEAAIISSCGSPFGLGSDIGGSIRIPCCSCGIFGHKMTSQLISTKGMTYRTGEETSTTMLVAGPIARYAEDLIPGIKAILGPRQKELQLDLPVNIKKLKYFRVDDSGDILCSSNHPDCIAAYNKVVQHLTEISGSEIENLSYEGLNYSFKLFGWWLKQEADANFEYNITGRTYTANAFTELFKYATCRSQLSFPALLLLLSNRVVPQPSGAWVQNATEILRNQLLSKLGDDGVLIYFSSPLPASYHHTTIFRPFNASPFGIFNVLKFPVTQVPLGLSRDGLPIGIQIAAAPYNDRLCIAVAKELEKTFGGYVPPFVEAKK